MLKSRDKNEIIEELDSLCGEFSYHIIKNHMIPARKLLDKIMDKLDDE